MKFTNVNNISVPMAVFLANDSYDYDDRTNVISVTSLMKSVRQIVLGSRIKPSENPIDISSLLASRLGTAIHDAIESAWVNNYKNSLEALGYPQKVIDRVQINPEPSELTNSSLPVYLEKRSEKQIGKWIVSGKFDMIFNGMVQDVKSTGTFTFTNKSNDLKYILQLSLYRWLNPTLINNDHGAIQFLFKDWNKNLSFSNPKYPSLPVLEYPLPLTPIIEIEQYVTQKLADIEQYWEADESELPMCTDEDTWRGKPKFKYFGKEDAKRASKVFDDSYAAQIHLSEKGKGIVREVKATPTGCLYCSALNTCSQGQGYLADGSLQK